MDRQTLIRLATKAGVLTKDPKVGAHSISQYCHLSELEIFADLVMKQAKRKKEMSVRYQEVDCTEDYEVNFEGWDQGITREDKINTIIEYCCERMSVWELLEYFKSEKRKELDQDSDEKIDMLWRFFQ